MPSAIRSPSFFIVGAGRSGTTLVQNILSAHPEIAVPPETHFLKFAARKAGPDGETPADFEAMWADLVRWSRFTDLDIDPDIVRAGIDASGQRNFATIFAAILTVYADGRAAPRFGEKTPGHYAFRPQLERWYPEAKFIIMRRDPRDVVASQLRTPWVREQQDNPSRTASFVRRTRLLHVADHARLWRDAYGRFLSDAGPNPRYHLIVYEDLARDPEAVMRAAFDFLGETFDPSLLEERSGDTHTPQRPGDDWVRQHHAKAAKPISTDSIGKWREALSPFEQSLVESICGDVMEEAGYTPIRKGVSRNMGGLVGHAALAADALEQSVRRPARRLLGLPVEARPHQSSLRPSTAQRRSL